MPWFAAHLVVVVRFKQPPQEHVPAWEHIVLVEAASEEEAFTKAEARGAKEAGDDGGALTYEGRPAERVFAGVRLLCETDDPEKRPGDGTEITYLPLTFDSVETLHRFLNRHAVLVRFDDTFERDVGGAEEDEGDEDEEGDEEP